MKRPIKQSVLAVWAVVVAIGAQGNALLAEPPTSTSVNSDQSEAPSIEDARALQRAGQWEEAAVVWREITKTDRDGGVGGFSLG